MTRERPPTSNAAAAVASGTVRRTALRLALVAGLAYALTGGGRVVGSDEVAMLELSRAMLRGGIAVPEGATLIGPDGRHFTKNAAAQAVLALPVVAAAEQGARLAGLRGTREDLAVRFGASFLNAMVTAALLAVFYAGVRRLGIRSRPALASALLLGFATPLWPYAKTFMAEPLQALGLLVAALGTSAAGGIGGRRVDDADARFGGGVSPELLAGLGAFLAVSVKLSMLPLVLGVFVPLVAAPVRAWRLPAAGIAAALVGHAIYNAARFGTPFETGYGAQATGAAYTTPLLVGLYGLVLSSGKGVAWFAPPLLLAPFGFRRALAGARGEGGWLARLGLGRPVGRVAWSTASAWAAALLLYGRFQHWAGDGSFGPRYLIPVMPLGMLLVAVALTPSAGARVRRSLVIAAAALGILGCAVQIGGVGIYFGAQMREAGDYPYRLPLDHPRFMSDSHFNPRFSPICGHWRMLARNLSEHIRGEAPRFDPGSQAPRDARLALTADEQRRLLHAIDLWWLYLSYVGFGPFVTVVLPVVLLFLWVAAVGWLGRALRAEAP